MPQPFTLHIEGFNRLGLRIKQLPAKIQKEVSGEIGDSSDNILGQQLRLVPRNEGRLSQGLSNRKVNDLEWENTSNALYSPYIEFGTKGKVKVPAGLESYAAQFKGKGAGGSLDDFFLAILDWVKRKGIAGRFSTKTRRRLGNKSTQLQEDFAVAFPIAMSILRKGINPQPFFFPPYILERPRLLKNIDNVLKDL